jgi:DNA-binding NarL/FixJ family response regulator
VSAYVTRDQGLDDLRRAIAGLGRDEAECTPHTAAVLLRRVSHLAAERKSAGERNGPPAGRLTPRETEILRLIARGESNKRIGRELNIELATVKNHVHNILHKLGASSRSHAVAIAREPTRDAAGI